MDFQLICISVFMESVFAGILLIKFSYGGRFDGSDLLRVEILSCVFLSVSFVSLTILLYCIQISRIQVEYRQIAVIIVTDCHFFLCLFVFAFRQSAFDNEEYSFKIVVWYL